MLPTTKLVGDDDSAELPHGVVGVLVGGELARAAPPDAEAGLPPPGPKLVKRNPPQIMWKSPVRAVLARR